MPQARSGGSRGSGSGSSSRSRSSSKSSGSTRAKSSSRSASGTKAKRSTGGARAKRSTSSRSTSSRSTSSRSASSASRARSTRSSSAADQRLEAAANRLRKLNERIIDAGREAGETTLTSYERALKAIADTIEKGPGSSDIEWVSNLATAQAKFIRDLTSTWASRARKALK